MRLDFDRQHWALILGASSGFGLATAKALARHGMSVIAVHRDRRGAMAAIDAEFEALRQTGAGFLSFNVDALSPSGRATVLDALAERLGPQGRVRLLLHSIALGNLKPIAAAPGGAEQPMLLEDEDFAITVHAMGTSIVGWAQELRRRNLFSPDARVLSLTSEGSRRAWRGYAAVGAAKGALEAVTRSLALELGPFGIRANVVQAGVTDTPALRLIPGNAELKAQAEAKNPLGRLTTPADVADFICLLCTDAARWVNGAVLCVDGGERIAG